MTKNQNDKASKIDTLIQHLLILEEISASGKYGLDGMAVSLAKEIKAEHAALNEIARTADKLNKVLNFRGQNEFEITAICDFDNALAKLSTLRGEK